MSIATNAEVIDPDLPIIDCHHHLWIRPHGRFLVEEFAADLASGHKVVATVYVECSTMYRQRGPEAFKPVGEAEFVAGMAAMSDSGQFGPTRMCAGFVGALDFTLGDAAGDVLDALSVASGGRLRGIRGVATWDADASINTGVRPFGPRDLLSHPSFRSTFRQLTKRNLVYDAWQYHPQLPAVCALADAFPDAPIVVNHCGGLLGINAYAGPETFDRWKTLVTEVSRRPNTFMKLGGLAAGRCGFGFQQMDVRPSAPALADLWRPYVETCIDAFGPKRCMFESNVPPDNVAGRYRTLWNTFKLLAAGCSSSEKSALFSETAARVYRIDMG